MDQARLIPRTALGELRIAPFLPRAPWWGGDLQTLSNYLRRRASLDAYPGERLVLPLDDGTGDSLSGALSRPAPGGPSRPLCRLQYHAGRSEDLGRALAALPAPLKAAGVVAVGFSLGGNMLLKYLGEQGAAAPLRAAVSVSAPIDLALTSRRMMQGRRSVYQTYLLRDRRIEAVAPIAEITETERRLIARVRSIWEYDERFTAPRNGYPSAAAYYEHNAAQRFLGAIGVPTLVIHALDDPWVPSAPYRAFDGSCIPSL